MPVANPFEKLPVAGISPQAISAVSNCAANAICSATLAGAAATQVVGLTQLTVTSSGATSAGCTTVEISGLQTAQIVGGIAKYIFGVPAGAGVPAVPLALTFDPPLLGQPGATVRVQMGALGAGHVSATINLSGKIVEKARGT